MEKVFIKSNDEKEETKGGTSSRNFHPEKNKRQ